MVPLIRTALNSARNRAIDARNENREKAHLLLKDPDAQLSSKLHRAREEAKHRRITDKDVIYRSDRNQSEQARDFEGDDFDRRLGLSQGKQKGRSAGSGGDALSEVRRLFRESA